MKRLELKNTEYYNYIGEAKYSVCGEITGIYMLLGSFNEYLSIVSCPFDNVCYLVSTEDLSK